MKLIEFQLIAATKGLVALYGDQFVWVWVCHFVVLSSIQPHTPCLACVPRSVGPHSQGTFFHLPLHDAIFSNVFWWSARSVSTLQEGLTLRARGLMSVREDVPEDGAWHAWETLAEADDAVASFWGDLCQWISERKQQLGVQTPPSESRGRVASVENAVASFVSFPVACPTLHFCQCFQC